MAFSSCGSRLYALSRCPVEGKDLQHDFLSRDDSPPKKGVNLLNEKIDLSKKSLLNLKLCGVTFKSHHFWYKIQNFKSPWCRATSKKLTIFSMKTGQLLPGLNLDMFERVRNSHMKKWQVMASPSLNWKPLGCELQLPLRFDKVCVFPGHKAPWTDKSLRIFVCVGDSYEFFPR